MREAWGEELIIKTSMRDNCTHCFHGSNPGEYKIKRKKK